MYEAQAHDYLIGFIFDATYLAGIPLLMATLGALIVAVLQALTQIQDQNLSQTVKIVVIVLVFIMVGPALIQPLVLRTERVLIAIQSF